MTKSLHELWIELDKAQDMIFHWKNEILHLGNIYNTSAKSNQKMINDITNSAYKEIGAMKEIIEITIKEIYEKSKRKIEKKFVKE